MSGIDARSLLERLELVGLTGGAGSHSEAGSTGDIELEPLSGGVSSDIWLVRTPERTFVLKRPLEQLRVSAHWQAPVDRGASEAAWLAFVADAVPGTAPKVLGYDGQTFALALEYLDPAEYSNWKTQLLAGEIDVDVAREVGEVLGRIHSASARTPGLAERFSNQELFEALRIEPYLMRTAAAVPQARSALEAIAAELREARIALVHGDVSPKNILIGRHPVILDAECASWGDPAFDAAFALTHLSLKGIHLPAHAAELHRARQAFRAGYLGQVDWEDPPAIAARIERLIAALMLARVAGASPAEYLTAAKRATVRRIATEALRSERSIEALLAAEGDAHE